MFQNSEDADEFVRRRVTPRARATVIPGSGVLTDLFAPSPPDDGARRRRELGVPETGVLVVMVSRVIRPKGVLELATAALTPSGAPIRPSASFSSVLQTPRAWTR